ncbi:LamG domain-containing protein [Sinomicrobium weinanense]|uniref:PKD domain-containing protein n=1 Tax=Sinomicrobium weinanense TaxID=2842200 RepID=A0A926JTB7_9FLAO|nr:PKD domain-containing protein [Sinomicrobium weinanense]MBC9797120.1 PKD domain-containing protein [Sinomicrobium weinanense]MBU3124821.1 PKD domain-containing protein [Sinomicrobium weinanense]
MKTRPTLLILTILTGLFVFLACDDDDQMPLQAAFEADTVTVAAGDSVVFSDRSTGAPATWNWTFEGGDPSTSVLSAPSVVYNEPGTYSVTLELTNNGGSDKIVKEDFITVTYGRLSPDFSADRTTVLASEEVQFTDKSTGIAESWAWEFKNENGVVVTATGQHPVVTFEEIGTYSAKLSVSNPEASETLTKEDYITVLDPFSIEADFTAGSRGTYSGGQVTFEDTSVGTATSWSWTFEGGTPAVSTVQNPTVTYSTPGKYKVTLTASNEKNSSTLEKEAYVVVIPGENLAAYYPYDGDASDAGPNNIAANNIGGITFDGTDRRSENAAVFNGSGALVIPDNPALNFGTSDFSVAVWVKTGNNSKMMVWQESGANGSRDNQAWMRVGNNDKVIQFAVEDSGGGAFQSAEQADLPGDIFDGQWHHIVCVRKGLTTSLFVDGVLVKQGDASSVKEVSNAQDFKIGAQEGPPGEYKTFYTGMLDDLVIYNKALTDEEIVFLFEL